MLNNCQRLSEWGNAHRLWKLSTKENAIKSESLVILVLKTSNSTTDQTTTDFATVNGVWAISFTWTANVTSKTNRFSPLNKLTLKLTLTIKMFRDLAAITNGLWWIRIEFLLAKEFPKDVQLMVNTFTGIAVVTLNASVKLGKIWWANAADWAVNNLLAESEPNSTVPERITIAEDPEWRSMTGLNRTWFYPRQIHQNLVLKTPP